jgi:hypothetical protein
VGRKARRERRARKRFLEAKLDNPNYQGELHRMM